MTGSIDAHLAATYAADKLRRLDRCQEAGIKPFQTDGPILCLNDQFELVGRPLEHDPAEVERLRRAAGPLAARLRRVPVGGRDDLDPLPPRSPRR